MAVWWGFGLRKDLQMKIANAFSISMLPTEQTVTAIFSGPVAADEVKDHLGRYAVGEPLESVIGHADTAKLVSEQIGVNLQVNRIRFKLAVGERLIVAQYVGPRLPKGATELPEGARIDYYMVVPVKIG